jgi:hypothetical protein
VWQVNRISESYQAEIKYRQAQMNYCRELLQYAEDPSVYMFERDTAGMWVSSKEKHIKDLEAEISGAELIIRHVKDRLSCLEN